MKYDVQLGMLATEAVDHLLRAEASGDEEDYERFLLTTAKFCESVSDKDTSETVPQTTPREAEAFISAVMKTSPSRSSENKRARLQQVKAMEAVVTKVLAEHRKPKPEEQMQIARMLYATSAAQFD